MRTLSVAAGACVLALTSCTQGPQTPNDAARAFLEANLRGDFRAARELVVSAVPVPEDHLELAVRARFARSEARQRVSRAAVSRFGPAAAEAFPPPHSLGEELRQLDVALIEGAGADRVVIPVGKRPLVARRMGWGPWKRWKIEIEPPRSEDERQRMAAVILSAGDAAEATIRGIERGEHADAREAAAALLRHRLEQLVPSAAAPAAAAP